MKSRNRIEKEMRNIQEKFTEKTTQSTNSISRLKHSLMKAKRSTRSFRHAIAFTSRFRNTAFQTVNIEPYTRKIIRRRKIPD
jgi:Mg2+ and Co2+ transporter CorA